MAGLRTWPSERGCLVRASQLFFVGTCLDVLVLEWFVGLGFCFVRAENAFWSSLLHLAAQVLAPGVGDVASA